MNDKKLLKNVQYFCPHATFCFIVIFMFMYVMTINSKQSFHVDFQHNNIRTLQRKSIEKNVTYILLWTQIRSGSRFTAEIIALNFDVFYVEEPVAELYDSDSANFNKINISSFLLNILNCKHHLYPLYYDRKSLFSRQHNKDLRQMKDLNISKEEKSKLDEAMCNSSPFRFGRIVVPTLDVIQPLIAEPGLNLRLILLIRDPRAITESRKGVEIQRVIHRNPCDKMRKDLLWAMQPKNLKHSIKVFILRYEDLALQPISVAKKIYKFLGFPFTSHTKSFIESHTQLEYDANHPFSTWRRSSKRISDWRLGLDYEVMKEIQDRCLDILNLMNYKIFKSEEEYKNINIKTFSS